MAAPYPMELRQRVVDAYNDGEGTFEEVAERFKVGEATVNRWVNRARRMGAPEVLPMGGKRRDYLVTPEGEAFVKQVLADVPDSSVPELVAAYKQEFDVAVSESSMKRVLKRLGYTRKRGSGGRQLRSGRMLWRAEKRS